VVETQLFYGRFACLSKPLPAAIKEQEENLLDRGLYNFSITLPQIVCPVACNAFHYTLTVCF